MWFDLPVDFQELSAEIAALADIESGEEAIATLVSAAKARGIELPIQSLEELLSHGSAFDAVTQLDPSTLGGQVDAKPTWGADCGNSTFGHTCCWHCY